MIGQNEIGSEHFLILGLNGDLFLYGKNSNASNKISGHYYVDLLVATLSIIPM